MFVKDLRLIMLFDFYGELLTATQKTMFDYYYNDDLSLSEIAADVGISRQGIRHLIKKGEEQLEFFESKLGLAGRHSEIVTAADQLTELRTRLEAHPELKNECEILSKVILTLSKGNQDVPESY